MLDYKPDCLNCDHYKDVVCVGDKNCECPRCQIMTKEEKKNEQKN